MSLELHLYLSPGITSSNLFYAGISNCSGSRFPVLVFMSGHNIAFGRDLRPAVTMHASAVLGVHLSTGAVWGLVWVK